MTEILLEILTIICQLAIITIIVFNILSFYFPINKIFNLFRDINSFVYLFLFFIYLNLCHFSNNTSIDNESAYQDNKTLLEEQTLNQDIETIVFRILRIKKMIVNRDKKLFFILIPILITLININANYKDKNINNVDDSEDVDNEKNNKSKEDKKRNINICLNNNWTIILFAILIIVLNSLKRFGISKLISTYNLDYFTLGVFLIFIIQNIFLDDIKTYIVESVFIFYPLIDSFSILSKKPNGGFIDLIKILSEYPIHNMFLTSIPVLSLGVIMLIMKFFKDCTEFTLVIGTVVLSLIALYHLITILYIINRKYIINKDTTKTHDGKLSELSDYISKFKSMMIVCLNERELKELR